MRYYRVPYQGTLTLSGTDSDLLEVLPADDKPCRLVMMRLCQISEVGDAAEEGLRISILRLGATVTSGSGGSAVTPAPTDSADTAAGFAAECNNTTIATTGGTTTTLEELGWNIRATPTEFWWPDVDLQCKAKQGEALIIRCQTTVADDISIQITFIIAED